MGSSFSKKKYIDNDNNIYYVSKSLEGYNVHEAYDIIVNKYKDYKVFLISNKSTTSFVANGKRIFIIYAYDNNTVKSIEIYDW